MAELDWTALSDSGVQETFVSAVQSKVAISQTSQGPQGSESAYTMVSSAMVEAARETLPARPRSQPDWFAAKTTELHACIAARDTALDAHHRRPSAENAQRWRVVRKQLKTALRAAKSDWILAKCSVLNDNITSAKGTKRSWDTVKELRDGLLGRSRPTPAAKMKLADGSYAKTPEENAGVFASHFQKLYGFTSLSDDSVVELLRQRTVAVGLDHPPTTTEVRAALGKLRNTAPGDSGIPARAWKALGLTDESLALVMGFVLDFWESEEMPTEWETGLLKILPKKGDRSLPGNYRGIMLLEVAYKIVANILFMRLSPIMESPDHVDHESQCGFRAERGCPDASYTVKQLVRKRREHGLLKHGSSSSTLFKLLTESLARTRKIVPIGSLVCCGVYC